MMPMSAPPPEAHSQNGHDHDSTEVSEADRLRNENAVLRNWIIGVMEGCEGCTNEARGYLIAHESSPSHEETGT